MGLFNNFGVWDSVWTGKNIANYNTNPQFYPLNSVPCMHSAHCTRPCVRAVHKRPLGALEALPNRGWGGYPTWWLSIAISQ